jgi:excisionase family DNA binding protein
MPEQENSAVCESARARRIARAPIGRLLTLPRASEYLGLSQWKLRRLVHDGRLPVVQLNTGEKWWLDRRDLDGLVERCKQTL